MDLKEQSEKELQLCIFKLLKKIKNRGYKSKIEQQ